MLLLWGCVQAQQPMGYGNVDSVEYLAKEHELQISGWAASDKQNVFATNVIVALDEDMVYRGRMQRFERPDVARAYGRAEWIGSGFVVRVQLPDRIHGTNKALSVRVRLGNGDLFPLSIPSTLSQVALPAKPSPSAAIKAMIVAGLLLPLAGLLGSARLSSAISARRPSTWGIHPSTAFYGSVALSFAMLVGAGSTGSSLPLLFEGSEIAQQNGQPWLGENRAIRSDEWEVITPLAISQLTHSPPYPVINRNQGEEGQNSLITGMTGLPAAHVSTLSKPATWGFFFLDLRRALAWYWWMPIFGCFAALHGVLTRMLDVGQVAAAGLAAAFTFAPYSVGFSAWPAYTAFFPLLAMLLAAHILSRASSPVTATASAVVLGLALGGFALVLYPPWQISLATLFLLFFASWIWVHRTQIRWGSAQWLALATAMLVATIILGLWWRDASPAIEAIRATVYPGQRVLEVGGDIDPWFLLKGMFTPLTMYQTNAAMDPADASSYVLFPIAFCLAAIWASWRRRATAWISGALVLYTGLVMAYMFIGSTPAIARWTLWGSVTSYRLDLALGMAQTLLWGWLLSPYQTEHPPAAPKHSHTHARQGIALSAALFTLVLGFRLHSLMPPAIAHSITTPMLWAFMLMSGLVTYLVLVQRHTFALSLVCGWSLIAALPFNPLSIAPKQITVAPALIQALREPYPHGSTATGKGTAVIDERTWSLILPMANEAVANSVFYAPPASLWQRLDPQGIHVAIHNRYQRLFVRLDGTPVGPGGYAINSPRLDEVVLTLDAANFDFRLLGVRNVLSPLKHQEALSRNKGLEKVTESTQWIVMRVK